jgi:DNA-binding NarL/FixJ family response regulator
MRAAPKTRIICVDDHKETRDLFELLLDEKSAFEVVASLNDVSGLQESIARTRPALVLLDRWMPGPDSLDTMQEALANFPDVRFLVLSSDDDPSEVDQAIAKGASGYVLKDGDFQALVAAIARVAAGEQIRPRSGLRF